MLEKLPHAVGQALSGLRAGAEKAAFHTVAAEAPATLRVTSAAFADTTPIPARYTADGEGLSPPLAVAGVPDGTAALVLFVEDPDAPSPTPSSTSSPGTCTLKTGASSKATSRARPVTAPGMIWAATPSRRMGGCRRTRRPVTGRTTTCSRSSRWPAPRPCPARRAAAPCSTRFETT